MALDPWRPLKEEFIETEHDFREKNEHYPLNVGFMRDRKQTKLSRAKSQQSKAGLRRMSESPHISRKPASLSVVFRVS